MTRYLLGIFLVFLLTTGCNSAFRANSTFIRVSPPVAKYLQHKEVVIHNNDSRKDIYRKVSIEVPRESDSLYRLKFKKIKGETIILEITDSFQNIKNVAIPQSKLRAYPVMLSTTIFPVTGFGLASVEGKRKPVAETIVFLVGFLSVTTDLIAIPLSQPLFPHHSYAVPHEFTLKNIADVTPVYRRNSEDLFEIPKPINPNPSAFLNKNYQKTRRFNAQFNMGYGIPDYTKLSTDDLLKRSSRMKASPWMNGEFNMQTSPKFQWGFYSAASVEPTTKSSVSALQMGFIQQIQPNAQIIFGVGAGLGSFTRLKGNSFTDSINRYNNKILRGDSLLHTTYTFKPDEKHNFMPITLYLQYSHKLHRYVNFNVGLRATKFNSYFDYTKTQVLKNSETIAPGIIALRSQIIGEPQEELTKTKNILYQMQLGFTFTLNP
jgi:hypothetical protein